MQSKKYTAITGASSGIGLELSLKFAQEKKNLILIARSEDKLNELKNRLQNKFSIECVVLSCDLSDYKATQKLCQDLSHYEIEYLANNAGFGEYGEFRKTPIEKEIRMIQVNISSLTMLSKAVLTQMIARKEGIILNIASTASFQPGPLMAVYYATKAYVLSFSEAIAEELKGSGVTVTAYCPGPTISGFTEGANMGESKLFQQKLPSSKDVALDAYKQSQKGKVVAIHGLKNCLLAQSVRVSPRFIVRKLVAFLQRRAP